MSIADNATRIVSRSRTLFVAPIVQVLHVCAIVAVLVGVLFGAYQIFSLEILGTPVAGAVEFISALMVVIIFGGLARTQAIDAHITVDLVYQRFPQRVQVIAEAVAKVLLIVFYTAVAWRGFLSAQRATEIDERSQGGWAFPTAPFKWFVFAGALAMILTVLTRYRVVQPTDPTELAVQRNAEEIGDTAADQEGRPTPEGSAVEDMTERDDTSDSQTDQTDESRGN